VCLKHYTLCCQRVDAHGAADTGYEGGRIGIGGWRTSAPCVRCEARHGEGSGV
jgi:hypothetical protein